MTITFNERLLLKLLICGFFCLFSLNFAVHVVWALYGHDSLMGFTRFFNFYEEANLPTWYASLLLTVSGILLLSIANSVDQGRDKKYWFTLAFLFFFLSIDETAKVHELIGGILSNTSVQSLLPNEKSSAWVFYGGLMCALVVVVFLGFWLRLRSRVRILFFCSAVLYVGGALGLEVIEIYYLPQHGSDVGFYILVTIEESLEMLGILLFIYALIVESKSESL